MTTDLTAVIAEELSTETDRDTTAPAAPADARSNVLATLKERRRKAEGVKSGHVTLARPIGVLEDDAVALYKYVPMDEAQRKGARLSNLPEEVQLYYGSCDTLIMACVGIQVRVNGTLTPLDPGGEPVTFSDVQRVLTLLGWLDDLDAEEDAIDIARYRALTARGLLLDLFGSEYAIIAEAQRVSEWMTTLKKGADEAFLDS